MAANFDLTNLAVTGLAPGNELLYDNAGMPSIMVKIPKMTYKQLGMGESTAVHPAFIVNGTEVDAIYISKYLNIVQDGRAYSIGGVDPAAGMNFDQARQYCEAKGEGWHCMTRIEWGLILRWCIANGFLPKGNTSFGKHPSENVYKAIPTYKDGDKGTGRTATGTGPLTWYHDQTPSGIADLTGNIWEWSGGVRMVYGELQILANNNGADSAHSQSATSAEWKAINAADGTLITPNGSGTTSGSVKADHINNKLVWSTNITVKKDESDYETEAQIECDSTIKDGAKLWLYTVLPPARSQTKKARQSSLRQHRPASHSHIRCRAGAVHSEGLYLQQSPKIAIQSFVRLFIRKDVPAHAHTPAFPDIPSSVGRKPYSGEALLPLT